MADNNERRLKFDPTINAGHILTFVAMVIAVMSSYSLLDKRIGVLEEKAQSAVAVQTERQGEQKEALKEIKQDIKDLQRTVNDISRAITSPRK